MHQKIHWSLLGQFCNDILFGHVPAFVGNKENDRADKIAKSATNKVEAVIKQEKMTENAGLMGGGQ